VHTLPAQRQDCHQDKTHGSAEQWGRAPAAGPLEARPGPAREGVGVAVRAAARLAHRQAVAADDGGRVNPVAHEHICALQQLGRDDDDGRRTVADLLVLQLGQLDQDLRAPGAAGRLLRRALRPTAGPAPPARLRCCPILSVLCQGGRPDGGGGQAPARCGPRLMELGARAHRPRMCRLRSSVWTLQAMCSVQTRGRRLGVWGMRTFAAGCSTSNSRRMVAPSLVMVTSPMSSTSIWATGRRQRHSLGSDHRCGANMCA